MCRIASLFLLQRLKGSKSGDARDFNNIETRAIIKSFLVVVACFLTGRAEGLPAHTPTRKTLISFSSKGRFSVVSRSPINRKPTHKNLRLQSASCTGVGLEEILLTDSLPHGERRPPLRNTQPHLKKTPCSTLTEETLTSTHRK